MPRSRARRGRGARNARHRRCGVAGGAARQADRDAAQPRARRPGARGPAHLDAPHRGLPTGPHVRARRPRAAGPAGPLALGRSAHQRGLQLLASIAALHDEAASYASTRWAEIAKAHTSGRDSRGTCLRPSRSLRGSSCTTHTGWTPSARTCLRTAVTSLRRPATSSSRRRASAPDETDWAAAVNRPNRRARLVLRRTGPTTMRSGRDDTAPVTAPAYGARRRLQVQ